MLEINNVYRCKAKCLLETNSVVYRCRGKCLLETQTPLIAVGGKCLLETNTVYRGRGEVFA